MAAKPQIDELFKMNENDAFRFYVLPDLVGIALVAAGVRTSCAFESSYHIGKKATRLLQSYVNAYYPGVIISAAKMAGKLIYIASKKKYEKISSQTELGKILGFSCADEWKALGGEPPVRYSYALEAIFINNSRMQFFTMMCLDDGRKKEMETMRKDAENAFKTDPIFAEKIRHVVLKINKHISQEEIGSMIIRGDPLDTDIQKRIQNTLKFSNLRLADFDLKNPVNRGILSIILIEHPMFYVDEMPWDEKTKYETKKRFDKTVRNTLKLARKTRRRRN